jgi:single-stranded-DNA-specific exonuclease
LNKYIWEENGSIEPDAERELSRYFDIPTPAARFLVSRSCNTVEKANDYLRPDRLAPVDPFLFENMDRAVSLIKDAIAAKDRILIHGDYDVDGICGTALLYEYLYTLVPHVFRFLPDRRKDGYGIASRAVDWAIANRIGLFIAVDCGTSDDEAVARLESAGIKVVICDHHELPVDGTAGGSMLNPVREGEAYPFHGLCGAGVAYKLTKALEASDVTGPVTADSLLDFVALATVADMAPLVGENRRLVREGLARINGEMRVGIDALKHAARVDAPTITSSHIGFMLAPRINAPGRIANPKPALEMLTEKDKTRCARFAAILETDNERRRELTDRLKDEVIERVLQSDDWQDSGGFIMAGKDWDEGVLGIAASRVVEEFAKPALLISLAGEVGKGSGRSVPGVHLKKQLDRCKSHLERFGGHAQAVGFSIDPSRIEQFREDLSGYLKEATVSLPKRPQLKIDGELSIGECSMELLDFLETCEPFGLGNRNPVWKIPRVTVSHQTRMVGAKHLKLFVSDSNGATAEGVSFSWARRSIAPVDLHGRTVDLAVVLKKGYYLNRHYAEIQVLDMRESEV